MRVTAKQIRLPAGFEFASRYVSRYAKRCPANSRAKLRRLEPAHADSNQDLGTHPVDAYGRLPLLARSIGTRKLANRSKLTVGVGGMSSAAHDLTGVFDAHSI